MKFCQSPWPWAASEPAENNLLLEEFGTDENNLHLEEFGTNENNLHLEEFGTDETIYS
jgi:hypothetical protein